MTTHTSVLADEVVEGLCIAPDATIVDATIGGAGHFGAILNKLGAGGVLVGIDADPAAVARAESIIAHDRRASVPAARAVEGNFRNLSRILSRLGVEEIKGIVFDLGWNTDQLTAGRGFSFKNNEPLLMTYGTMEAGNTAADLVNKLPERELADLIYAYGEERFARKIAKSIVTMRKSERILSTHELVKAIEAGVPASYRRGRLHPATKTFQALRIAVNDELGAVTDGVAAALELLAEGGRLLVITFHSIEDRRVKELFRSAAREGLGSLVNKSVITPSRAELLRNPRARSAKLRIFERGVRNIPDAEPLVSPYAYA